MASTDRGRDLTEAHRLDQQQVRSAFLVEFLALWQLLDSRRLDETSPGWIQAVLRLIQRYRQRSAEVSAVYYVQFAEAEAPPAPARELERARVELPTGVRRPEPRLSAPEPPRQVEPTRTPPSSPPRPDRTEPLRRPERAPERRQSEPEMERPRRVRLELDESLFRPDQRRARIEIPDIDWTPNDRVAKVSLEVTGPVAQKIAAAKRKPLDVARDASFTQAAGAATRQVLTGGRKSLLTLLEDDPQALGWIRVTDGDPCAFCALLASRGVVYKESSFAASDPRFEGPGQFKVHDHCACTMEPVYSRNTLWPGRAKEFRGLWRTATEGFSGKDARNAFRRAYEAQQREARRNVA